MSVAHSFVIPIHSSSVIVPHSPRNIHDGERRPLQPGLHLPGRRPWISQQAVQPGGKTGQGTAVDGIRSVSGGVVIVHRGRLGRVGGRREWQGLFLYRCGSLDGQFDFGGGGVGWEELFHCRHRHLLTVHQPKTNWYFFFQILRFLNIWFTFLPYILFVAVRCLMNLWFIFLCAVWYQCVPIIMFNHNLKHWFKIFSNSHERRRTTKMQII